MTKIPQTLSEATDLLTKFHIPDSERYPIIVDSHDWDNVITPALCAHGTMMVPIVETSGFEGLVRVERVLFETIYVMGYRRGKAERTPLTFKVAEERG